jgi:hypothetical protein
MPHHGVLQNRDEQRNRRLLPADGGQPTMASAATSDRTD